MPRNTLIPVQRFLSRRFGSVRAGWLTLHRRAWPQRLDRLTAYLSRIKRENAMSDFKVEIPTDDDLTIVMTRTFEAPRALVWKAMTEPQHIARWWGAKSVSSKVVVAKHEMRVGGAWRFESHGHDGTVYVFLGEFLEIAPPEKVVQTFGMEGMFEGKVIIETMTLEDLGDGRTQYRNVSRFESKEDRDGMVASGMEVGARQSLDQLEGIIDELQAAAPRQ